MSNPANSNLLALDVGDKRIGVAVASSVAKLPRPLATVENNDKSLQELQDIVKKEDVGIIVIGLPRGLEGQETAQTGVVRDFRDKLETVIKLPIHWQDEALTSVKAEKELRNRGLGYNKDHVDALAATYILEDYLREHQEEKQ